MSGGRRLIMFRNMSGRRIWISAMCRDMPRGQKCAFCRKMSGGKSKPCEEMCKEGRVSAMNNTMPGSIRGG
jgi:uncharacterized protein YbjQ (UPF0145 family)